MLGEKKYLCECGHPIRYQKLDNEGTMGWRHVKKADGLMGATETVSVQCQYPGCKCRKAVL